MEWSVACIRVHCFNHADIGIEKSERGSLEAGHMEHVYPDSDSDQDMEKCESAKPKLKRSLVGDVKQKLAFLRRKPADGSKDGKSPKPTPEVALSWSRSFDTLLSDKYGLELFRDFLRTEFSDENIGFWIACEEFKSLAGHKLAEKAQQIYSDFVAVQAPHEINLDSKTRFSTMNKVSDPDRSMFEVAQRRIQALMEKDSYPRFLQTPEYQQLLGDQKHKLKIKKT